MLSGFVVVVPGYQVICVENKRLMAQVVWEVKGMQDGMQKYFNYQWVVCLENRACWVWFSDDTEVIWDGGGSSSLMPSTISWSSEMGVCAAGTCMLM